MSEFNHLCQPVGYPVVSWAGSRRPLSAPLEGCWCQVVPLDANLHSADLYSAYALDLDDGRWTYLPYGPFANLDKYYAWVDDVAHRDDPMFFAIINSSGKAVGVASYQHIEPLNGSIEVGHISFSTLLQATTAATEAMYLMMRNAFEELGYRRYEWKCDSLNKPSRLAAERLGFSYEGTFRQMRVVKGRNRDTAWYSITDRDWSLLKPAFGQWLAASNFDASGRQRLALSWLTKMALTSSPTN